MQPAHIRVANIRNEGKGREAGGLSQFAYDLESSDIWKACCGDKGLQKLYRLEIKSRATDLKFEKTQELACNSSRPEILAGQ